MNALGYGLLFGVGAYLLGSLSFAVIVSKLFGLSDPRTYGSKNPGATNVMRSGNKAAAVVTLLCDALKGTLAVWLVLHFGPQFGVEDRGVALVALAVFVGHLWPVFFKFKGGKGVATFIGIMLGLSPLWLGLPVMLTWLAVFLISRYSSLAALVSSLAAPFFMLMFESKMDYTDTLLTVAVFVMVMLLYYRHSENIGKLIAGKESKFGSKKK